MSMLNAPPEDLDLGKLLAQNVGLLGPCDRELAPVFAYQVLAEITEPSGEQEKLAHIIAVNALRQLFPGQDDRLASYADTESASDWLCGFLDAARTPRETCARTLAALLAHYHANKLVRFRSHGILCTYDELAQAWLQAIVGTMLPIAHVDLQRAIARIERSHAKHATKSLTTA